ncbi:hypothetical protein NPIL_305001 [Nephila pilipes]|uniref:Uncharacterized protein n=1 Tax=Nephila pilipes TaxID=299642 RepID=A0A8X6U5J9_NEPPI|nr:hypothetical protein NPIL_305001 [Nephila pilipes]
MSSEFEILIGRKNHVFFSRGEELFGVKEGKSTFGEIYKFSKAIHCLQQRDGEAEKIVEDRFAVYTLLGLRHKAASYVPPNTTSNMLQHHGRCRYLYVCLGMYKDRRKAFRNVC